MPLMMVSALHAGSGKGIDVPVYCDLAALHPGADIHVGIAVDDNFAVGHLCADAFDPGEITVEDDLCLSRCCSGFAGYIKVVPEPVLLAAYIDRETEDLSTFFPASASGEMVSASSTVRAGSLW